MLLLLVAVWRQSGRQGDPTVALAAAYPAVIPPAHSQFVGGAAALGGSSGQPLPIRIAEATRHWFGPRPVALLENGWYSLTDLVQRRSYWLTHTQPTPLPLPPRQPAATATVAPAAARQPTAGSTALSRLPTVETVVTGRRRPVQTALSGAPAATPGPAATPIVTLATLPKNLTIPKAWPQALGEGVWVPAGQRVAGQIAMEHTFVLPDPQRPYARVDLVWINPALAQVHVAAGTRHPNTATGLHGTGEVPLAVRPRLLAAFNGGFKRIGGSYVAFGFRADGTWYRQPSPGLATLAVYPSGRVVLGAWGRDLPVTPEGAVASAGPLPRDLLQNLPLLVDHGHVTTTIADRAAWGETVNNAVRVWRSGLGQTAAGDLVYAAGTPLTAETLAQVLAIAGAQRAMELDINSYWVTFNFYTPMAPGSAVLRGQKLLPAMVRPAVRYLWPDSRDFVYLTAP